IPLPRPPAVSPAGPPTGVPPCSRCCGSGSCSRSIRCSLLFPPCIYRGDSIVSTTTILLVSSPNSGQAATLSAGPFFLPGPIVCAFLESHVVHYKRDRRSVGCPNGH